LERVATQGSPLGQLSFYLIKLKIKMERGRILFLKGKVIFLNKKNKKGWRVLRDKYLKIS